MMVRKANDRVPPSKLAIEIKEPEYGRLKPNILVVGVGGAGNNAVSNLVRDAQDGVDVLALNTDAQSLENSLAPQRLQLGPELTQGLGAGADPEVGRQAAEESREELRSLLQGYHICFIAAGMGGGTGTGASPVVAKVSREEGLLTVAVVTLPFHFEGRKKMGVAITGQETLLDQVDTMIVIPNQNLFKLTNEQTSLPDAFRLADNVLCNGVRSITDLILRAGLKNLDFNDVRSVMSNQGLALIGSGTAEGENRARIAAESAINNPLLDELAVGDARNVLINITAGFDITAFEVDEINSFIRERVHENADVHWGANIDEAMQQRLRVSVIVTGLSSSRSTSFDRNAAMDRHQHSRKVMRDDMTASPRINTTIKSKQGPVQSDVLSAAELAMLSEGSGQPVMSTQELDSNSTGNTTSQQVAGVPASSAIATLARETLSREEQDALSGDVGSMLDTYSADDESRVIQDVVTEAPSKHDHDQDGSEVSTDGEHPIAGRADQDTCEPMESVKADKKAANHPQQRKMFDDDPSAVDALASLPERDNAESEARHDQAATVSRTDYHEGLMLPELPEFLQHSLDDDQAARLAGDVVDNGQRTDTNRLPRTARPQAALLEAEVENAIPGEQQLQHKPRPGFLALLSRKWGRSPVEDDPPLQKTNTVPEPAPRVTPPKLGEPTDLLYPTNNDDSDEDYREIPAFLRRQVNHE